MSWLSKAAEKVGEALGLDNDDYRRIRRVRDHIAQLVDMTPEQRLEALTGLDAYELRILQLAVEAATAALARQRAHEDR